MSTPQAEHCIGEAAELVTSNAGAAERLLTAHRPGPDGFCRGCGQTRTRWPCVLATIARAAQDLRATRHA